MRWAGHGEKRNACSVLVENRKERDIKPGGKLLLILILEKYGDVIWTRLIWLWIKTRGWLL
jgi:hypothetical protein